MSAEAVVLDPQNESTANAPLWLHARGNTSLATGVTLAADGGHAYPEPDPDPIWVSSVETEGELRGNTRKQNRTITNTLWIVEPSDAAATNKAVNPTAGKDTTGWTNNSLVLMERQTTLPARLDGFDTAIHATANAGGDAAYLSASVTNGVAETASAWIYVVSGTVRFSVYTNTGPLSAESSNIAAGAWRRVVVPYTPNSTGTYSYQVNQIGAGTSEFYVTGVQIGPADPYFSGDTPGCYWSGTRGNSSSIRRAPGGARYAGIKSDIEDKVAKLDRSGGTYRRTTANGDRITFDVIQARVVSWAEDPIAELRNLIKCELEFVCKPYGRGDEVTV